VPLFWGSWLYTASLWWGCCNCEWHDISLQ